MRAVGVVAIAISGLLLGAAPASASGGATIGPMQINPVADSQLCWQAAGDGAPIALEACDPDVRNQQWSLTPDGVLMNGIGYCLEAPSGQPQGTLLYIDFVGQCDGSRGQVWTYTGSTGHLSSSGTGTCAAPGGPIAAGTQVVQAACRQRSPRWSIGYSAVTLAAGPGSRSARGSYSASVTVANAASAQTAYGVAMTFGLPRGLAATAIHAAGGASGFRCDVTALTCTGTLPAGTSGRIDISGRLPRDAAPGTSYTVSARAAVRDTSQLPGTGPPPFRSRSRSALPRPPRRGQVHRSACPSSRSSSLYSFSAVACWSASPCADAPAVRPVLPPTRGTDAGLPAKRGPRRGRIASGRSGRTRRTTGTPGSPPERTSTSV